MVEHMSATGLQADRATILANFSSQINGALTLDQLNALFRDASRLEGACRHRCFAVQNGRRRFLFGDGETAPNAVQTWPATLVFPIIGWDERAYEVEIALFAGFAPSHGRASLHAMATLYLCRGLALIDAEDEPVTGELTAIEFFCFRARNQGRCDLDIADDLDRSVHAVAVHCQRADRKLGC